MPHSPIPTSAVQSQYQFEGVLVSLECPEGESVLRRGLIQLDDGASVMVFIQGDIPDSDRVRVERWQMKARDVILVFDSVTAY